MFFFDQKQQNICGQKNLPQILLRGISFAGQFALWLSGLLALIGLFWRQQPLFDTIQTGWSVLALVVLVACILIFSHIRPVFFHSEVSENKGLNSYRLQKYTLLIPALALGLILPWNFFIPYVAFLGLLELLWWNCRDRSYSSIQKLPETFDNELESDEEFEDEFDENTLQQIVRRRTEDGRDRLEASYLVEFENEQLTVVVHLPFCPVFNTVPKVEAFLLDESSAKVILSETRVFGIRIEVKREKTAGSRLHLVVIAEEI